MNPPDTSALYITSVVTLYLEMPDTPLRVSGGQVSRSGPDV